MNHSLHSRNRHVSNFRKEGWNYNFQISCCVIPQPYIDLRLRQLFLSVLLPTCSSTIWDLSVHRKRSLDAGFLAIFSLLLLSSLVNRCLLSYVHPNISLNHSCKRQVIMIKKYTGFFLFNVFSSNSASTGLI